MTTRFGLFCLLTVSILLRTPVQGSQKGKSKRPQPTRSVVYKKVDGVELKLHIFQPDDFKQTDKRPAIVFFFGGGWVSGSPSQFYPHSAYLASRGMVAMAADYRVKNRNKTTPFECVRDGKSAIRWVRGHAAELGIDPERIDS